MAAAGGDGDDEPDYAKITICTIPMVNAMLTAYEDRRGSDVPPVPSFSPQFGGKSLVMQDGGRRMPYTLHEINAMLMVDPSMVCPPPRATSDSPESVDDSGWVRVNKRKTLTYLVENGFVRFAGKQKVASLFARAIAGTLPTTGPVVFTWDGNINALIIDLNEIMTVGGIMRILGEYIELDDCAYAQLRFYERMHPDALPPQLTLYMASDTSAPSVIQHGGVFNLRPDDAHAHNILQGLPLYHTSQWLLESDAGVGIYEGLTQCGIIHTTLQKWVTGMREYMEMLRPNRGNRGAETSYCQLKRLLAMDKLDTWKLVGGTGKVLCKVPSDYKHADILSFTMHDVVMEAVQREFKHVMEIVGPRDSKQMHIGVNHLRIPRCDTEYKTMACQFVPPIVFPDLSDPPPQPLPTCVHWTRKKTRTTPRKHYTVRDVKTPRGWRGGWTKSGRQAKGT